MPIKELNVSFRISVEALAQALATSNSGMHIDVLGTEAPKQITNGSAKQLPAPSARRFIVAFLRQHPDQTFTTKQLREAAANHGFSASNFYSSLTYARNDGLIRKYAGGKYRIAKAGLANG